MFKCLFPLVSLIDLSYVVNVVALPVHYYWTLVKYAERTEELTNRANKIVHTKLVHSVEQIFTNLGQVYESHQVSIKQFVGREKNFYTPTLC